MKPPGIEAAKQFVTENYPHCNAAILSGSTAQGAETPFSDLDILVISEDEPDAYVEAFYAHGWMIEILMHNRTSYKLFFERDRLRGRPSLPHMFATGKILVDDGTGERIQKEARELIKAGPPPFSQQDIQFARFVITNHLLDLQGQLKPLDSIFAVNELAFALHELVLRANGCWIGKGKRMIRALKVYDEDFASRFEAVFHEFYNNRDFVPVLHFADEVLSNFGGRLFESYSSRKAKT